MLFSINSKNMSFMCSHSFSAVRFRGMLWTDSSDRFAVWVRMMKFDAKFLSQSPTVKVSLSRGTMHSHFSRVSTLWIWRKVADADFLKLTFIGCRVYCLISPAHSNDLASYKEMYMLELGFRKLVMNRALLISTIYICVTKKAFKTKDVRVRVNLTLTLTLMVK